MTINANADLFFYAKKDRYYLFTGEQWLYAKALDVKLVNVLPGRCLDPVNEYDYLDTLKHNLSKAATAFGKHNILVTFEAINTRDMHDFLIHSSGLNYRHRRLRSHN